MTRSRLSVLILFVLALAAVLPLAAQDRAPETATLAQQYKEILPSVWERVGLDGRIEHLALGPEGLAWALTQLHEQSNRELDLYLKEPTTERWARIEALAKTMEQMRADITHARSIGLREALKSIQEQAASCTYSYSTTASAGHLSPGATASSSASWSTTCGYLGEVYCYAYARVNSIYSSDSKSGSGTTSVSRSCSASVSGSGDCSSNAYAYVYVPALSLYDSKSASSTDCGSVPLSASLSCNQYAPGQGYPQVDCTGSASGGTPPYHAYWKEGSYAEYESYGSPGSGPWGYTTICKYLTPGFTGFVVRLRVVDGAGAQQIRNWYCGGAA
jgi:hypothetical protein